jgi:hypothetical protein
MKTLLATLLILAAATAVAAEPQTPWERLQAGEFVVFAEVLRVPDKQVAADGIEPITYLYHKPFFQPGPNGEPVDLENLAAECKKLETANNIVAIDLEGHRVRGLTLNYTDPALRAEHIALAKDVLRTIRKVRPEWKLGWYGHVPHYSARVFNGFHASRADGPQGIRYREWLKVREVYEDVARELGPLVDWLHPNLYMGRWAIEDSAKEAPTAEWYFTDANGRVSDIFLSQKTPLDVWLDTTTMCLRQTRRHFVNHDKARGLLKTGKPIIPAISPQWWPLSKRARAGDHRPADGEWLPERWTILQLEHLQGLADGAVIWSFPSHGGWEPQAFMESRQWKVIREWARQQRSAP